MKFYIFLPCWSYRVGRLWWFFPFLYFLTLSLRISFFEDLLIFEKISRIPLYINQKQIRQKILFMFKNIYMKSIYAANIYIYIAGYKSIKIGIKFVSFDPLMHVGYVSSRKSTLGNKGFHFMSFFHSRIIIIIFLNSYLMRARFFM